MKKTITKLFNQINQEPRRFAAYAVFVIALFGMLGSLYYSNYGDPLGNIYTRDMFPIGEGFPPCRLCWYARILLYPMVPITLLGILKKDKNVLTYLLPLSVLGVLLTTYHSMLQWFPNTVETLGGNCDIINPCNVSEVAYLGFITIPFLGFIAFTLITAIILLSNRQRD